MNCIKINFLGVAIREDINDQSMIEILEFQKAEANSMFGKFIERNYEDWFYQKRQTNIIHTNF
jgi:hypothetical protein